MVKYKVKVLYDNGVEEIYNTGEVDEKQLLDAKNDILQTFNNGLDNYLVTPNKDKLPIIINLSKVSKVEFLKDK